MKKITVFLLSNIVIFIILMTSCDYAFEDTFYIQNSTDKMILLVYQINDFTTVGTQPRSDSLFILPNEKKLVFNAHGAGGQTQYRIPIKNIFSKFSISCDSIASAYDYYDDNNWIYTKTSTEKTLLTADYIMIVEPSHFEE